MSDTHLRGPKAKPEEERRQHRIHLHVNDLELQRLKRGCLQEKCSSYAEFIRKKLLTEDAEP
jgi:hypothetical protein